MSTIIHDNGDTLHQLPTTYTFKPGSSGQTVETWKGPEADILTKASVYQSAGWETTVTQGPVWQLTATYNVDLSQNPDGESTEPEARWELVPNPIEQSIFECGRPFVLGLPSNVRANIETKLKNQKASFNFITGTEDTTGIDSNTDLIDLQNRAARVYHYKQMGADARLTFSYTLKRSIVVPDSHDLTWDVSTEGKVLSTNAVTNIADVPSNIQTVMPSSGYANETVFVQGYYAAAAGEMVIPFTTDGWTRA